MNKLWIALTATMILTGCGSEEVRQSSFDIQQRRQIAQENAAKEARVRQEQEDLARIRQQQRTADHAILVDPAHGFVLRTYYVTTQEQQRQIEAAGFSLIDVVPATDEDVPYYLYYSARRNPDQP